MTRQQDRTDIKLLSRNGALLRHAGMATMHLMMASQQPEAGHCGKMAAVTPARKRVDG